MPITGQASKTVLLIGMACMVGSCGILPRPAVTPLPTMWDQQIVRSGAKSLAVMLPGRLGRLPQYRNWGFFDLLREQRPDTDIVATDLHIGYYQDHSFLSRLHEDVVAPARARGVEQINLVGISLGGFGALAYSIENPGEVDQIVILAPFLGDDPIIDEIEAAGGLAEWQPGTIGDDDFQRRLWAGLRERLVVESGRRFPQVWLGYANGDRFARANRLLADHLPRRDRVFTIPGGHDWPEWRQLFKTLLSSGGLASR